MREGQKLCRSWIESDECQVAIDDEHGKLDAINEFHPERIGYLPFS
jgi:hypothetical protein